MGQSVHVPEVKQREAMQKERDAEYLERQACGDREKRSTTTAKLFYIIADREGWLNVRGTLNREGLPR